jgi:hypothetical protein
MTRKEIDLMTKYAKMIKIDPKIVIRVFKRDDKLKREITIISTKFIMCVEEAKKRGEIIVDEKGKVDPIEYKDFWINFVKDWEKNNRRKIPTFFTTPLPMKPIEDKIIDQKTS